MKQIDLKNSISGVRKTGQIACSALAFLIFFAFSSRSQNKYIYAHAALAEKIYLQPDGKIYTTDKTIWFKAVVVNASDHTPTLLSGVLYVELIGPDEKIAEKKLIKLEKGIGEGFFQLNQKYPEGYYQIRAYTEWNKNFGTDFFFKEYIQVFAPSEKTDPISKITLVEKEDHGRRLTASIDPSLIDSRHKKDLTLIIGPGNNKKDTLSIERNNDGQYVIDYAIPDECQFVTLQIQTKNQVSYFKTIALSKDQPDLQFFPESGELVHGIMSQVGFKALDYNGKGKYIEGEIVNEKDEIVTSFKSNELGMGSFILNPDSSQIYYAKIKSATDEKLSLLYPLPAIARLGNVLSVAKRGNEILVKATSNYLKNDSIYIRISCRGLVYYDIKGPLKGRIISFFLPAGNFPEGILAFTMMDTLMNPVAERLYFNERPETRLNLTISAGKDTFTQRELTKLNIETRNMQGEAVNANLSVLVLNKEQMGQIQSTRQNILSYFLLSSDLRGTIENPGFYFRRDQDRYNDLDALLLTQGWRKYNYIKPPDKIVFQPEPMLTVSGTVGGSIFQNNRKKEVELTMMTFGEDRLVQTQKTDSLGRFYFNVNDEYGQNLNILIQSANKAGKKKDYSILLDKKESPEISFEHIRSIEEVDTVVQELVEKNIERKSVDDAFPLSKGDILIGEVVVEGYRMTPERKKVMNEYGKPDVVIDGGTIREKEAKWSYGLYSVLLFNFPDKVIIERGFDGNLYAKVKHSEMTLVVIDGVPVRDYEYPFIPNISPSEVSSFEIIEHAKNFSKLYLEAFPYASPMDAPAWGDVIAIYTFSGKGLYGAHKTTGILQAAIPVFSAPREFYAPKYENLQPTDWTKPDLRALVHWEPELLTDSLGHVSATFYNADIPGEMQVVVEAISEKGETGYQEFVYHVKKKD
jgi:hypothetical protein